MDELLRPYLDIILKERFWSWALVGIVYLLLAFMIRGWFTAGIVRRIRALAPRYCQEVRKAYLKKSLWGWFCFFMPLTAVAYLWNEAGTDNSAGFILAAAVLGLTSFILSIMMHLEALAAGLLEVLEKYVEEKEVQAVVSHPGS